MGKADQYVFGLDIGTRSVVGTVGYKKNADDFTVVAQEVKMHDTRAMLDGQIHDIGKVAETIKQVKRSLEKQLGGTRLTDVCIAAAGRVLKTVTVRVDETFPEEITIKDVNIREMELMGVEKAYAAIKADSREDNVNYYCVAYTVVHYYLNDFQMSSLSEHKGSKIGADVLATFLPDEVIEGLYTTVEKAGLKVNNLTLEPIAAILVAIPEKFRLLNIALVDVGAGTSDICITKDGSITAYGMIPMAGDALTEVVAANHLVEFNTAEAIKLAAATRKKTIPYTDIMGLKQKTTPAEVNAELKSKVDEMAKRVADRIIEVNGGKTVSACFVVGGGGKVAGFTESLAKALKLPKERVALRGEEVLSFVESVNGDFKPDPMFVTPIGICLNYYEKKNNFVYASLNGDSVKLYDNNKLTVIDVAIAAGYPNENLFPKRGKALEFKLNGQNRFVRGELGEAAVITVNGKPASVNTLIEPNDDITIVESTVGADGTKDIERLPEFKSEITFIVDGKNVTCPKFMSANGNLVSGYYSIKQGDEIETLNYYTLGQILECLGLDYKEGIYVNNEIADRDTKVYENFKVELERTPAAPEPTLSEKVEEIKAVQQEEAVATAKNEKKPEAFDEVPKAVKKAAAGNSIVITFNGIPMTLSGKSEYRFVDASDQSGFDIKKPQGNNLLMTVNKMNAAFIDLIKDGDSLELHWTE